MANSDSDSPRTSFLESDAENDVNFFRALHQMWSSVRETCIPVVVLEREDKHGYVKVKPVIRAMKQMSDKMEGIERGSFFVKPMKLVHGGFTISVPLFVGDTGYVIACDRDSTSAIKKNEALVTEDLTDSEVSEKHIEDPDTVDCSHYIYGFFIPCSWIPNDADDMKELVGSENGQFKDSLVIANTNPSSEGQRSYISIDRDGKVIMATEEANLTLEKKVFSVKSGSEGDDDSDSASVDENGVELKRKLNITDGTRAVLVDPKDIETDAKFMELTVIAGQPTRDGDNVSIPVQKVKVLCASPVASSPLVFNVHDADR